MSSLSSYIDALCAPYGAHTEEARPSGATAGAEADAGVDAAACGIADEGATARVKAAARNFRVPGLSVAVLGGGCDIRRAYGYANLESPSPASVSSNYRLASLSKQFTAAAVLLLAEQSVLRLDDPLRRWLPSLGPAASGVTLRHMLNHTSGLVDFEELMAQNGEAQIHEADVLGLLATHPRTYFDPGTRYRYSNTSYALLPLVVERASGMRYAAFVKTRIFAPLGMRHSVAHEAGVSVIAHRAFGYTWREGCWRRTDQSRTSATLGDGGVYSSIEDLARWDAALDDGRLLGAQSWRQAFAPATPSDDPAVAYGFGWRISTAANGSGVVWHSGETTGFSHVMLRYLKPRLSVILLGNRSTPSPLGLAISIATRTLGDGARLFVRNEAAGPDPGARPLGRDAVRTRAAGR